MANEKIATRIKVGLTGEEFVIGTTGQQERVSVKLRASDTTIDWTDYEITVLDVSTGESADYSLNENGECLFVVPIGHIYQVSLPAVGDYAQPSAITQTASMAIRRIDYTYQTLPTLYEQVNFRASIAPSDGGYALVEGFAILLKDQDDVYYTAQFHNGVCSISVPYGKTVRITVPTLEGFTSDHRTDVWTTGSQSRNIVITFLKYGVGVWGRDAQGNNYTTEEIAALPDKSIIVAGCFNSVGLANASREDGSGTGCGFMWSIASPSFSAQWATQNIQFTHEDLPDDSAVLAYVTSSSAGDAKCAGARYSAAMIRLGDLLGAAPTAAHLAAQKSLTIAGSERHGFVLGFGQIHQLSLNRSLVEAFYSALGKSAPTIWSGSWWTSCQYNASNAVTLLNGGFGDSRKTLSYNVFCAYDL